MINDNTILSSFDDKPTLLEWLKKVEDALKSDTATAVSVENPSANTYVFKITFADGKTLSSGNVVFPDSVKDVSIKNGHIIVTSVGGNVVDLGVLNPYADTIVVNAETQTTEIGGKLQVSGDSQVTGNAAIGGNLGVTGQAVVGGTLQASSLQVTSNESVGGGLSVEGALGVTGNATIGGRLQADSSIISNGEIRGGNISGTKFLLGTEEMPLVKANPTGEATETLEKIKIGNVAYNVGGGSDYTAGNNIEISASKAIAVKSALTGIESVKFSPDNGCILKSGVASSLELKGSWEPYYTHPSIWLYPKEGSSYGYVQLIFNNKSNKDYAINFYLENAQSTSNYYAFLIRDGVPPVLPKTDGTYILKATVSGNKVTYAWELQQ